jgi:hypothetical protein
MVQIFPVSAPTVYVAHKDHLIDVMVLAFAHRELCPSPVQLQQLERLNDWAVQIGGIPAYLCNVECCVFLCDCPITLCIVYT